MIRVLHLRSQYADFQTEQTAALLQDAIAQGLSIQTRRIGNGADYRHAISAGCALRRERFDVLHAWDAAALTGAAIAGNAPILYSPSEFPTPRAMRLLRAIRRYRDVWVISSSAAQQRAFAGTGIPSKRCVLIRPGVEGTTPPVDRRQPLRAALGFHDSDHVVLCPGESTRAANHELATWVVAILHVHDPRHKILLWGRGPQAKKAARLSLRLHQPDMCRLAENELGQAVDFSELTAAADTVLHTATAQTTTLPLAVCMAARLPIVSLATSAVSDILEDQRNAIVLRSTAARTVAQRILELRADTGLVPSIAAQAEVDAKAIFSPIRCRGQYRALYFQLAGASAKIDAAATDNSLMELRALPEIPPP